MNFCGPLLVSQSAIESSKKTRKVIILDCNDASLEKEIKFHFSLYSFETSASLNEDVIRTNSCIVFLFSNNFENVDKERLIKHMSKSDRCLLIKVSNKQEMTQHRISLIKNQQALKKKINIVWCNDKREVRKLLSIFIGTQFRCCTGESLISNISSSLHTIHTHDRIF